MKRQIGQVIIFAFLFMLSYQFLDNSYSTTYLDALKSEQTLTVSTREPLYEEIKQKAHQYEDEAVDAVIDPVWKAIPGYNGIEVDIEKSYENMKKDKTFNESKLVLKEKKPNVTLQQLEPAPIYKGNPKKPMVAFQVNVAWGNDYLLELLKIFKKHNINVTFNLDGSWTKKNPRLAKMIVQEGHEIGNHAYTHPDFQRISNQKIREELKMTNDVIEATVKRTPKWFAPPSGSYNNNAVQIARELNMGTILWTIDTVDWKSPHPYEMANRIIAESHAGAMILMHPTKSTTDALDMMIEGIQKKGFKISTVSDLVSEKRLH
ncbi:polysaccharide deacetylase family protein [Pueribacillus sp. YX66]|uniref:polysaccharide deacetylase family protein n=1 Tax=Pueribacillus sp. YX66 TaxID=3229242 RepID=UPI00358D174F